MEKLSKSKNGQWKLTKASDEIKNRRAEQTSRMAEQGQGEVKANTSDSIYNIPNEAKDFNSATHLYHPEAPDELHRLNQHEWNDHFQNMIQNPKLSVDQLRGLASENTRRSNIIDAASGKKYKNNLNDPRARKRGESDIDYKVRIERDFGHLDRMSPEDKAKFHQEFDLSTKNLAQRNEQKKQEQIGITQAADKYAADAEKIKHDKYKQAQASLIKQLPLENQKEMNKIYERISNDKEIASKFSNYLHIVHEVRPDGSVANISYNPKGHQKETLKDFISSMRGEDAPYTENRFLGLEDINPYDTAGLINKKGA